MLIKDVIEYFSGSSGIRKIKMSASNFTNWHKQGFIPIDTQMRIEKLTNGDLKADLNHLYNQNDVKLPSMVNENELEKIYKKQNYLCAICCKPESKIDHRTNKVLKLSLDHCHNGGFIRGLLCSRCNRLLGLGDESSAYFYKVYRYLKKYED